MNTSFITLLLKAFLLFSFVFAFSSCSPTNKKRGPSEVSESIFDDNIPGKDPRPGPDKPAPEQDDDSDSEQTCNHLLKLDQERERYFHRFRLFVAHAIGAIDHDLLDHPTAISKYYQTNDDYLYSFFNREIAQYERRLRGGLCQSFDDFLLSQSSIDSGDRIDS